MSGRARGRRLGRRTPARFAAALVVVLVAVGGLLVAAAAPAGAHGGAGTMGIEVEPGAAPLTARVRVLLEYANDREVAPGATVLAEARGPDGATVGPTTLSDLGEGRYDTVLTMPVAGPWTVTVTADEPPASATAELTVVASASSTAASTGDIATSSDRTERKGGPADGTSGGPSPALLAAIAVVLVAAVGIVFVLWRRRSPREDP